MTHLNDPNIRSEPSIQPEPDSVRGAESSSFTPMTWASLAFIALLFFGVALWAYSSGDMQSAAVNRPGAERNTIGQGGTSSKAPATAPSQAPTTQAPAAKETAK